MNLVELNLDSIPFGQPIPFALRGVGGSLLANKGYVLQSAEELRNLVIRGQTLYVDTDESGDSYRAYLSRLQAFLLDDKPLNKLSSITMQAPLASAETAPAALEDDLSQAHPDWKDWQHRLTYLLRNPDEPGFLEKFFALFDALAQRTQKSPDPTLLALIQLSAEELRLYSATHSMLVSAICMVVARETLNWPEEHILTLGRAALSMNIGMSHLQDQLAQQVSPISAQQAEYIDEHPDVSVQTLRQLGINDPMWLEAVRCHHQRAPGKLSEKTLPNQMARLIQRADIFGARISPRAGRHPLPVTAAMQACYYDETKSMDEAGAALVKTLGIYPPGAWIKLASGEIGIVVRRGSNAATPKVMVLVNRSGMVTGEPIPRDTALAPWKVVSPVAHKDVRVRLPLEKLLSL